MRTYEIEIEFAGKAYKTKVKAESPILARDKVRNAIEFVSVELVDSAVDKKTAANSDILGFLRGFNNK